MGEELEKQGQAAEHVGEGVHDVSHPIRRVWDDEAYICSSVEKHIGNSEQCPLGVNITVMRPLMLSSIDLVMNIVRLCISYHVSRLMIHSAG